MRPWRFFVGITIAVAVGVAVAPLVRSLFAGGWDLVVTLTLAISGTRFGSTVLAGLLLVVTLVVGTALLEVFGDYVDARLAPQQARVREGMRRFGERFDQVITNRAPAWLFKWWALPATGVFLEKQSR